MFAACWSNWLLRYYINNNPARYATATITSPAVASLASMLEKCRVLVRDRGEKGLSALPDPDAGVLCGHGQSLRVTAPHTVVCQAGRRSRRRGGGRMGQERLECCERGAFRLLADSHSGPTHQRAFLRRHILVETQEFRPP